MNVAFHLTKKDDRIAATNITTVDGENIELSEDRRPSTTPQQRTIIDATQRYAGTVLFYNWDKMFGSIRIDAGEEIPEEVKNHKKNGIRREGSSLYFHWKDLVSTDKIRGINSDIRVSFTLYTDQKGVGAADIRPENGGEFSGVVRIRRGPRNRGRGARAEKAKETPAKASTDEEEEEKEDPPKERPRRTRGRGRGRRGRGRGRGRGPGRGRGKKPTKGDAGGATTPSGAAPAAEAEK